MARDFVDLTGDDVRELPLRRNHAERNSEVIWLVSDEESTPIRSSSSKRNTPNSRPINRPSQNKTSARPSLQSANSAISARRNHQESSRNNTASTRSPPTTKGAPSSRRGQKANASNKHRNDAAPPISTSNPFSLERFVTKPSPNRAGKVLANTIPPSRHPGPYLSINGVQTKTPLHQGFLTRPSRYEDDDSPISSSNDALSNLNEAIRRVSSTNAQQLSTEPGRINPPVASVSDNRAADTLSTNIGGSTVGSQMARTSTNEEIQDAVSAQVLREASTFSSMPRSSPERNRSHDAPQRPTYTSEKGGTQPSEAQNHFSENEDIQAADEDTDASDGGIVNTVDADQPPSLQPEPSATLMVNTESLRDTSMQPVDLSEGQDPVEPVALELGPVGAFLKKHIAIASEDQTPITKASLQLARNQASNPYPVTETTEDPWANVVPVSLSNSSSAEGPASREFTTNVLTTSTGYTSRNKGTLRVQPVHFKSAALAIPKYKSIVRLGPSVLAENDRTLKYLPYFTEEEHVDGDKNDLRRELQDRFHDRVKDLPMVLRCTEKAEFYRDAASDFVDEIGTSYNAIMYFLHHEDENWNPSIDVTSETHAISVAPPDVDCPRCGQVYSGRKWDGFLQTLPVPSDRELVLASLAYKAFLDITSFSIWHVIVKDDNIQKWLRIEQDSTEENSNKVKVRCLTCGLHDCPTHGAYFERPTSESSEESESTDTDNELGHNFRQRMSNQIYTPKDCTREHLCGPYCVDPNTELCDLLGSHPGGEVSGVYNQAQEASGPHGLDDDELCDIHCFWRTELREAGNGSLTIEENNIILKDTGYRFNGWSQADINLYRKLLPVYVKHRRGPCLMAMSVAQTCLKIFVEMLCDMQTHPHTAADDTVIIQPKTDPRDANYWVDHSITHLHDERKPWKPCSHVGICEGNPECTCWREKVTCEHFCQCPKDCVRRFRGCNCAAKGKPCFDNSNCDCNILNRECDPWLCGSCGVADMLDPINRYNDEILKGRCRNAMIQRDRPKNTWKGISEVHGWGLFAGEDIRPNEFIGEYKGEIISRAEADRRGAVYHHRGLEYLFTLNKEQDVDSSRAGNKMRFINNSEEAKNQNCYARKMFCNGVQRIGLFAKGPKPIEPGSELFFHYGYPREITKQFWEKGERPQKGVATSSHKGKVVKKSSMVQRAKKSDIVQEVEKPSVVQAVKTKTQKPMKVSRQANGQGIRRKKVRLATPDEESYKGKGKAKEIWDDSSSDIVRPSRSKRKRASTDAAASDDVFDLPTDDNDESNGGPSRPRRSPLVAPFAFDGAPEVPESEDEYNEASEEEIGESSDADEDDDQDDESPGFGSRRTKFRGGDGRLGGEMQRKGWITRKKNMEMNRAAGKVIAGKFREKKKKRRKARRRGGVR